MDDLRTAMSVKSDEELAEVLRESESYRPEAIAAAREELAARGITPGATAIADQGEPQAAEAVQAAVPRSPTGVRSLMPVVVFRLVFVVWGVATLAYVLNRFGAEGYGASSVEVGRATMFTAVPFIVPSVLVAVGLVLRQTRKLAYRVTAAYDCTFAAYYLGYAFVQVVRPSQPAHDAAYVVLSLGTRLAYGVLCLAEGAFLLRQFGAAGNTRYAYALGAVVFTVVGCMFGNAVHGMYFTNWGPTP